MHRIDPDRVADHLRVIAEEARAVAREADALARDYDCDTVIDQRIAERAELLHREAAHWRDSIWLHRRADMRAGVPLRRALAWAIVRMLR